MPRKIRNYALRSVLSAKYNDNELVIVDDESFKTETGTRNELVSYINLNGWEKPMFLMMPKCSSSENDANLEKSVEKCSILKEIKTFPIDSRLNAYHVINSGHCIISESGIRRLERFLS